MNAGSVDTILLRLAKGLALAVLALFCAMPSAYAADQSAGADPQWYADINAIWLQRDQGSKVVLVENRNGANQVTSSLTTHSIRYRFRPGGELRIGRRYDAHNSVEVAFFALQKWNASAGVVPGATTPSSPASVGITQANMPTISRIDTRFSSQLYSGEINMRHTLDSDKTSLVGGLRYLQLPDNLTIQAVGGGVTDTTTIAARNQLVGLQVGAEHEVDFGGGGLSLSAKGGLFLNMSKQSIFETTNAPAPTFLNGTLINYAGRQNGLASMLEVGVRLHFTVNAHVSLQAGYRLMAIGGLALAPEQIALLGNAANYPVRATNGSAGTNHNGTMFLQGLQAGMTIRW